ERDDVLRYWMEYFLPVLKSLEHQFINWNDKGKVVRGVAQVWAETGEQPIVLVTHDECTFHSNDGQTHQWVKEGSQPLHKTDLGKGIMLSGFLTLVTPLQALEIIEIGGDCWWNNEKLVNQVLNYVIPIFELQYPGCQALFLFDNAPSHAAQPTDALHAQAMNLGPGGETPIMRDSTNFAIDDFTIPSSLRGKPCGLKLLLQEWGLWHHGLRLKCLNLSSCNPNLPTGCCAWTLLSLQPDFQNQRSKLEEVINNQGHLALLYPKFHCELNWIEYYWCAAKWFTQKHCNYSLPAL
ncbi:hypothetical protein L873DRAFT_1638417, partial [Choiromyces venosus 120613-1]